MDYMNLYNSLGYNILTNDLNNDEKQLLIESIANLDTEKKELIYLLMLHDYTKMNPSTKVIFPYKSKQIANDKLEIKVDALPIRLKRILYRFVRLAEVSGHEMAEKMITPTMNN
jgi:hypothetical protein